MDLVFITSIKLPAGGHQPPADNVKSLALGLGCLTFSYGKGPARDIFRIVFTHDTPPFSTKKRLNAVLDTHLR